jgi:NADPH-dependent FMN reductase
MEAIMTEGRRVLGLVGSYRRGGYVDVGVTAVLEAAAQTGCKTEKIYLLDQRIEFCANCRSCMQAPGPERGRCVLEDELEPLLRRIEAAEAYVVGAPVNFFNVNALTRRFVERCVGFAYWPWGRGAPRIRNKRRDKRAVLVSASGAPAWVARAFTGAHKALKILAGLFGARTRGTLWLGLVDTEEVRLTPRQAAKARSLGRGLA